MRYYLKYRCLGRIIKLLQYFIDKSCENTDAKSVRILFHIEFQPIQLLPAFFVLFSSLCISGLRESLNKNVLHKKMFSRSLPLASSSENLIGYRSSLGAYNQLCCFSFLLLAQCISFSHIFIDYAMIKHFGEGINYPINSPVLGFSERGT